MNISTLQQHTISLLSTSQPTIILGLSGGPDSVFLFHALLPLHNEHKITLHAVHVNHGWRESAAVDEQFCRDLCAQHNIELTIEHAAGWHEKVAPHKKKSASPESLAREIRRAVFEHVRGIHNAETIALAHHADDQRETFLLRLIRGSSLTGLCGMHARAGMYIRPLLTTNKKTILAWLQENNIDYCHDETNNSSMHLRNRIRATALPALLSIDERATHNIDNTIARLQDEEEFVGQIAQDVFASLINAEGSLPREPFCLLHRALQKRLLLILLISNNVPFNPSTGFFDEMIRFLSSPAGGSHQIGTRYQLHKKQGWFGIVA